MAYNEAQKRATEKYLKSLKNLSIRIKPEDYERYTSAAEAAGMSLRAFVLEALEEKIAKQGK
jgi:predicted HicB family RNase H-like nuclease